MEQFNLTRNLEQAMDTTISIARLMLSGTMDRFPNLRFVFSHMGGAFFALKNRMNPSFWDKRSKGFFDKYKKRIFIDTAPPFLSREEIRFAIDMMWGKGKYSWAVIFQPSSKLKNAVNLIKETKATAQVKTKFSAITRAEFFARADSFSMALRGDLS